MYVRKSEPGHILTFTTALHLHDALPNLDNQFVAAHPRLRRIVCAAGIPPAHQEDVVQETLLAGWRNRKQLREPERFDAWLDAICRNQCRLFWRANAARSSEQIIFLDGLPLNQGEADEIADPQTPDPLEDLDQQETIDLMVRALTHLTPAARQLLSLRYLADLPEREVAGILKVSVPALEARLHRARRQLRAVMEGPLRDDLLAAGLLPVAEDEMGWQTTSMWCYVCGKRRLSGRFETYLNGLPELRLRCPSCSPDANMDIYRTKGMSELIGVKAFRPAFNRSMCVLVEQTQQRIQTGVTQCISCGATVRTCIASPEVMPLDFPHLQHFWSIAPCTCPGCWGLGMSWTVMEAILWANPAAKRFMRAHPRWIGLPDLATEWQGRAALRFQLADTVSDARFTAFADARTLEVLDTFEENL